MSRRLIIAIVVLVGMLHCIPAWSANAEAVAAKQYNVEFYDRWADLPTDTLMAWGSRYLNNNIKRDSALLCYSIVANRYYEGRQNNHERAQSVLAMDNIGRIFAYHYYDYQKAYAWLQMSLNLATRYQLDSVRVNSLVNLGGLMLMLENVGDTTARAHAIDYYWQAWELAVKTHRWPLAVAVANDICQISYGNPQLLDSLRRSVQQAQVPAGTPMLTFFHHYADLMQALNSNRAQDAIALCDTLEHSVQATRAPERYIMVIYNLRTHLYSLLGDQQRALEWIGKT